MGPNFTKVSDFQSLEAVDRGGETQLQVTENSIEIEYVSSSINKISKVQP